MALTLSDVVREALGKIGRTRTFTATGGSATTAADSKLGDMYTPPEPDYAVGYSIFVKTTTDGLTPQGKYSIVTGYDATNYTYTFDTVTDAVALGDEIVLADDLIPLREAVRIASETIQKFYVPTTTTLTSAAQQTEYALSVDYKMDSPLIVEYQGRTGDANDNRWIPIMPVRVIPAAAGSTALLVIPQIIAGRTITITGMTQHPALTTYSSTVREELHPDLVLNTVIHEMLLWYNSKIEGTSDFWLQRMGEAALRRAQAEAFYPVNTPRRIVNTLPMWGGDYDRGVPDPILT